jgi:hypothetical protein
MLDNIESDSLRGAIIGGGIGLGTLVVLGLSYAIAGGAGILIASVILGCAGTGAFVASI